jgi:hypothetical protein
MLLYQSPIQFHIVVRKWFENDQAWNQAVELARRNIGRSA